MTISVLLQQQQLVKLYVSIYEWPESRQETILGDVLVLIGTSTFCHLSGLHYPDYFSPGWLHKGALASGFNQRLVILSNHSGSEFLYSIKLAYSLIFSLNPKFKSHSFIVR